MSDHMYVLPLKNIVVFPGMIVTLVVGREKSIQALEQAMETSKQIFLVAQKDELKEEINAKDLYKVGTVGTVVQLLKLPDGTVKVLVEGLERAKVTDYDETKEYITAHLEAFEEKEGNKEEEEALARLVLERFEHFARFEKKVTADVLSSIQNIESTDALTDAIAANLNMRLKERQVYLELTTTTKRLERIYEYIEKEIALVQVDKRIRSRVKRQMEKNQRDFYLNEQIKAIQKELGDVDDLDDIQELEERIKKTLLTKEAKEKAQSELKKLRRMSPMSAESGVIRNYLEWVLDIPWKKKSNVKIDLEEAEKILNEDHYGLEKVKERIIEYLAIQKRTGAIKGPILCLVGPPGVGKTSLAKSIARATGRKYVRTALGGMRDEAEIRGHRRTYIGSMPGRIIQSMKKAGTINPLMLLDEIDKLGADWRGDPSSALLEVLDPEQNKHFNDHYLELDYDLSNILFITTANTLNLPKPLLDRMEVIRLAGYTEDEKVEIAQRYLIPKQSQEHGLEKDEIEISREAVCDIIRYYSRESGVRELERLIAKMMRKGLTELMKKETKERITITPENLKEYLGVKKYDYGKAEKENLIGVTTGLAWTEVGGELLSIEAIIMPGKGNVTLTGKLGDVMKESISAAKSYVRSQAVSFGIKPTIFYQKDIHVHVPEGATPKDGPSAGIAMCTTMVSALTGIPVRKDIAMTGEITLQGRVLPIGGLKEKLLAALRGNIKTVLIPHENEKDLQEIPDNVKEGLKIIPVKTAQEVLLHALEKEVTPIQWDAKEEETFFGYANHKDENKPFTAH